MAVEKILEPGEELAPTWPVAGTTGYDFLNLVGGLFVDPTGEKPLTELHARFAAAPDDYAEVVRAKKHLVMQETLAADVRRVVDLAVAACDRHRRFRDHTRPELTAAITELVACFPVYRTYLRPGHPATDVDIAHLAVAAEEVRSRRPDLAPDLFAFLTDILTLRVAGEAEEELAVRFQQLTAPVMAKGAEDTAFYCWRRLVSLNEVGGDPGRFGTSVEEFHRWNRRAAEAWPSTMLALSTHDTKRSADVRARIGLLSEIPDQWALTVRRWSAMNDVHKVDGLPDRGAEYLLYQTLVGAWPLPADRAVAYMDKAAREAKEHTSWTRPDPAYDRALAAFVAAVVGDPGFTADLASFVAPLVGPGRLTALAQVLMAVTAPGLPDFYQGSELWDLSLVDPDNRRPVDYHLRQTRLREVSSADADRVWPPAPGDDGLAKMWLIHRALGIRRSHVSAFVAGSYYAALAVDGDKADHAVAYCRGGQVAVVVPRLVLGLNGPGRGMTGRTWGDTGVTLPPGRWTDALGGSVVDGGRVVLETLLARFPMALLTAE